MALAILKESRKGWVLISMYEEFIIIGIIVSLIYYELTETSPGGVITPGYLALFYDQPERIAITLLLAIASWGGVKILKQKLPIYGRRQFAFAVIFGIALRILFPNVIEQLAGITFFADSIGLIIPGLIANDMIKQSVKGTLFSMSIVTIFLISVLLLMGSGG